MGPCQAVSALLQLSLAEVSTVAAGREVAGSKVPGRLVAVASRESVVGSGIGVDVGREVGLAALVGGTDVLVGIAC